MQRIKLIISGLFSLCLIACGGSVLEEQGPRSPEFARIADTQTVVFIHGMYLTPKSWQPWEAYFQELGYQTHSPAWPLHDKSVPELNAEHPSSELAELTLPQIVQHYRDFVATLEQPPILVGHSMGGLVVQQLLSENSAAAGVILHSAPPFGVLSADPNFLKANWPHINPFLSLGQPTQLTLEQFAFAFMEDLDTETQLNAYTDYVVPESRRVGRAPLNEVARINTEQARTPLLFIAGGKDNIIPASLNYANFRKYENTPAITDYKQFPERNHWTLLQPGWEAVAAYIEDWLEQNRQH